MNPKQRSVHPAQYRPPDNLSPLSTDSLPQRTPARTKKRAGVIGVRSRSRLVRDAGAGTPLAMLPVAILPPEILPAAARWLDLAGLAVFAASGALAAAKRGQTFVTLIFFGLITGVGGGTVRDLLIDAPVFWIHDARAASMCLFVATLIWTTPARWWRDEALGWFDAVGLAAYAVFGAAKALGYGVPPVPAALMGVMSACVGGIIRDVLAGEPSILMRPELYVTAAALASATYVILVLLGLPVGWSAVIAASAGFTLRALAIRYHLALPAYAERADP